MYTIFQNGLLQYINTVWHDALIFYIKVICSTAMYQKNLAFVFCIFLSFSNRSRSMKNYASLEWDFEFHCTTRTHYSSSKRSSFVHFQFSTIFGSKPNVQTNIELVKFFIALNIQLFICAAVWIAHMIMNYEEIFLQFKKLSRFISIPFPNLTFRN